MNEFKIYKKQLAYLMRLKGFKIIRTEPNKYRPQWDVYVFEDTEAFRKTLTEITNK